MRTAIRRYRALATAPGVPGVFAASLIGRLPIGMATLLYVFVVHAGTGSYSLAGLASAANAAATALFGPPVGRLADRGHAALLLVLTGLAQAVGLVGLVVALRGDVPGPAILALAAVTGAVNPPIAAVTRTVLPRLAPDEDTRQTAFALDAILIEITFVLGPALVGVVVAVWDGYIATLIAAAFNVIGSFWLAAAPSVRHGYVVTHAHSPAAGRWRRLIGPVAGRGLRTVLLVSGLEAAAFGVLEVVIPAFMNATGRAAAGGLLFTVWSCGSIVGGLWYGGMRPRVSLPGQYSVLMCLNLLGFSGMLLGSAPLTLGVMLFLAGLVISPTTAVEASLVTDLAPRAQATEAFTWSNAAIYLGFALGSGLAAVALAGSLGTAGALTRGILLAMGLCATGTLLTFVERRSLRTPVVAGPHDDGIRGETEPRLTV